MHISSRFYLFFLGSRLGSLGPGVFPAGRTEFLPVIGRDEGLPTPLSLAGFGLLLDHSEFTGSIFIRLDPVLFRMGLNVSGGPLHTIRACGHAEGIDIPPLRIPAPRANVLCFSHPLRKLILSRHLYPLLSPGKPSEPERSPRS